MFTKQVLSITGLVQLLGSATALPADQVPLLQHSPTGVQDVRLQLKKAEIIPTVIDDFLPSLALSVSWPDARAELGNTIRPKRLQRQPKVTLQDDTMSTKPTMNYVITLTDPDAPSRDDPEWGEMCHWIATNLSLSSSTDFILPLPDFGLIGNSGPDDVMPYKAPGPPPRTGKHRYVFLVFAPKNGTRDTLYLEKPKDRQHWGFEEEGRGVREWAEGNGLVPVGAQFVYAQNDKQ